MMTGTPRAAELVGDLVAAVDVGGHGGDADQIALQVEVDLLDVLVGQHHLVAVARDGRGDREQAGDRRVERAVQVERPRRQRIGLRIDEMDHPWRIDGSSRGSVSGSLRGIKAYLIAMPKPVARNGCGCRPVPAFSRLAGVGGQPSRVKVGA